MVVAREEGVRVRRRKLRPSLKGRFKRALDQLRPRRHPGGGLRDGVGSADRITSQMTMQMELQCAQTAVLLSKKT